ncbi:hypothetical protein pb186bvf_003258 [Paramecium bursaria]
MNSHLNSFMTYFKTNIGQIIGFHKLFGLHWPFQKQKIPMKNYQIRPLLERNLHQNGFLFLKQGNSMFNSIRKRLIYPPQNTCQINGRSHHKLKMKNLMMIQATRKDNPKEQLLKLDFLF